MTLALVRAASAAFGCALDGFSDANDLTRKLEKPEHGDSVVVVLDLAALAVAGARLANVCTRVRQHYPNTKIGLIAAATHHIDDAAKLWAAEAVEALPDWDLVAQPTPDYPEDQRTNW